MAINPNALYPGQTVAPNADYPYGRARNVTAPGDGTGTPWEEDLINDIWGFLQALLSLGVVVPSGNPETILASDYISAIKRALGVAAWSATQTYKVGSLVIDDNTIYYSLNAANLNNAPSGVTAFWTPIALPLTGGTLTGALVLNADPAVALGAATKQYVDNRAVPFYNGKVDYYDAAPSFTSGVYTGLGQLTGLAAGVYMVTAGMSCLSDANDQQFSLKITQDGTYSERIMNTDTVNSRRVSLHTSSLITLAGGVGFDAIEMQLRVVTPAFPSPTFLVAKLTAVRVQ